MKRFVVIAFLLLPVMLLAGNTFSKTFGGSDTDVGYSAVQCSNHDFILVGFTKSYGGAMRDGYLVRISESGDSIWAKNYDFGQDETFRGSVLLGDSALLVVGFSRPDGGTPTDLLVAKIRTNGDVVWHKTYGGDGTDYGWDIHALPDGNFVVSGTTDSYGNGGEDVWVLKINQNGDTLWTATFGGTGEDQGRGIAVDDSGKIYISAKSYSLFAPDMYMIKLNENGEAAWLKTFSSSGWTEGYDACYDGKEVIFAGYGYWGGVYSHDMLWIKMDAKGDTIRTGHVGGSDNDYAFGVNPTDDGGLILVGKSISFGNYWQGLISKVDAKGKMEWQSAFDGDNEDIFWKVYQTDDHGYLAVGHSNSTADGNMDVFVVKTDSSGAVTSIEDHGKPVAQDFRLRQNYPNPFNPTTTIPVDMKKAGRVRIDIYNAAGAKVATLGSQRLNRGHGYFKWSGKNFQGQELPSGVYIYRLSVDGKFYGSRKMILLR